MTNFILHQSVIQYINNNSKKLNSSKKQKKIDHTIHYSIFHCMIGWTWQKQSSGSVLYCRKCVLRNFAKFTGKYRCQSLFLIKLLASACNCIKKGTLAEVFSCEFCEIFKNTFSYRTPPVAASQIIALNKDIRPCSHYTV